MLSSFCIAVTKHCKLGQLKREEVVWVHSGGGSIRVSSASGEGFNKAGKQKGKQVSAKSVHVDLLVLTHSCGNGSNPVGSDSLLQDPVWSGENQLHLSKTILSNSWSTQPPPFKDLTTSQDCYGADQTSRTSAFGGYERGIQPHQRLRNSRDCSA